MKDLKAIVGDKNYFVITTNGECHFEMGGFAQENIYESLPKVRQFHADSLGS